MYVCICAGVTERRVEAEIRAGATTEDELAERCGVGVGCGSCLDRVCALLENRPATTGRLPARV